jgi:SAM-dependent methyltransferase
VGTDSAWDYKNLFWNPSLLCEFMTLDKNESLKPDIVGTIEGCDELETSSFNFVILIGVYEFVEKKPEMFAEINRILKPEGFALLSLPGAGFYESPNNHVEPWEVWSEVKPLMIKEVHVVGEKPDHRPTSVHVIATKGGDVHG